MILKTVFRAQADKTPGTTWSFTCWHFKGHQVALHTFPSRCMAIAITYSSNPRSFLSVMDATDVFFRVKPNFITLSSWFHVKHDTNDTNTSLQCFYGWVELADVLSSVFCERWWKESLWNPICDVLYCTPLTNLLLGHRDGDPLLYSHLT